MCELTIHLVGVFRNDVDKSHTLACSHLEAHRVSLFQRTCNLQVRIRSSIKDTAQVGIRALDADVSTLTPGVTPRVLDLPVVNTIVGTVTDQQDTVVKVLTALASEDTRLVQLERGLVGLDSDRDGLLSNGRHQSVDAVSSDVGVGLRGRSSNVGVTSLGAGAGLLGGTGSVRILVLSGDTTVLLDEGEGVVHPATVAASIGTTDVARNQLLLREGEQVAILVVVGTLKSTSGGERPARTALALVLHRSDSTLGNPVNSGRQGRDILRGFVDTAVVGTAQVRGASTTNLNSIHELGEGQVSELVQAKLVGVLGVGVVGLDQIDVVGEDLKTLNVLSTVLQVDTVSLKVLEELVLVVL